MIYYTELIKNNMKDNVEFGPNLDGKPLINTAKGLLEELGKTILPGSTFGKQDKPQLLHCLPQNIVELVDATLNMTLAISNDSGNDDEGKFTDLLRVIKDLMQKEKCNVYIIESEVRFLLNIDQDFHPFSSPFHPYRDLLSI